MYYDWIKKIVNLVFVKKKKKKNGIERTFK